MLGTHGMDDVHKYLIIIAPKPRSLQPPRHNSVRFINCPRMKTMYERPCFHLFATLAVLITLLAPFIACGDDGGDPGIHCHTDKWCHGFSNGGQMYLLETALNETDDARMFKNGENIACLPGGTDDGLHGGICAWVWNTDNTTTGAHIKVVTQTLLHHCKQCGSAPLDQSANILANGELTFGWSWDEQGCDGKCNLWGGSTYMPGDIVPSANFPTGRRKKRSVMDRSRQIRTFLSSGIGL